MTNLVSFAPRALLALFLFSALGACSDTVDGDLPQPVDTTVGTQPKDELPSTMNEDELVAITTSLDKTTVQAAEWAKVTCIVKDDKGQTAEISAAVQGSDDLLVDGLNASSSVAGQHTVTCHIPGIELTTYPAILNVVPNVIHQVTMVVEPALEVYELGDIVHLSWIATDAYGNALDDAKGTLSGPTTGVKALGQYGDHDFQFTEEGMYAYTVTLVDPNTHITDTTQLIVDGTGPVVSIKTPARGATLVGLGQSIEVVGTVEDVVGDVTSVTINGKAVPVDFNGSFVAYTTPAWGLNLIKVEATDSYGNVSVTSPSYHYAHSYMPFIEKDALGVSIEGGVELMMAQSFLDNGQDDAGEAKDLAGIVEIILSESDISVLLQDTVSIHKEWPQFNKVWPTSIGDITMNGKLMVDVTVAGTSDIGPTSVGLDSRKGGIDAAFDIGTLDEDALVIDLNVSISFPIDFVLDLDGIEVTSNATAAANFVVGARIDRLTLLASIDMHKNAGQDLEASTGDLDLEIIGFQIDPIQDLTFTFELDFPIIGDVSLTIPLSEYVDLNAFASTLLDPLTEQLLPSIINFVEPVVELLAGDLLAEFLNNFTMERTVDLPGLASETAETVVLDDGTEVPAIVENKKLELYSDLTTVQFEEVGAQLGLALGVFSEKGVQRSPLGAIQRDGCFINAPDSLGYDWKRAFGLGIKTDALNATLFAIWWSGFLNEEFDLGSKTANLDLGIDVTDTTIEMSWLLPPVLNDCQASKNGPKLQVGDLQLLLSTKINGVEVTAKIFLDFSGAAEFGAGADGFSINITKLDAIEIEVVEISTTMLGVLHLPSFFEASLTEWLPGQLEGKTFGPYNVPSIAFSDLMPGLPEGVSMDIGNVSVENATGYSTLSADLQ